MFAKLGVFRIVMPANSSQKIAMLKTQAMQNEHAPGSGASVPPAANAGPELDATPAMDAAPIAAALQAHSVALPPALPPLTRTECVGLAAAVTLHAGLLLTMLVPDHRIGAGGSDLEAIGVEIVTVAPALEARRSARGRGAAGLRMVHEHDGDPEPLPDETATRDSRRVEQPRVADAAPPPADLAVPDWNEPTKPLDAQAVEPIIARAQSTGAEPDATAPLRPSLTDQPAAASDSIPGVQIIPREQGGAAARGRETFDVANAAVMAAARAGRRDEYGAAVFEAIRTNAPPRIAGLTGIVKLEFSILPAGQVGTIRVVRSSGSERLDETAMATLRSTRFPVPPAGLDATHLIYDIPFTFE